MMNMLHVAWDWLPWWLLVLAAFIILAFCWQFIAPVWAILPAPVKWLLGAIGAIFVAVQYGRNAGAKDAAKKRADDNANAIETRKQIDAQVEALPPSAVDADLKRNKWMRDE